MEKSKELINEISRIRTIITETSDNGPIAGQDDTTVLEFLSRLQIDDILNHNDILECGEYDGECNPEYDFTFIMHSPETQNTLFNILINSSEEGITDILIVNEVTKEVKNLNEQQKNSFAEMNPNFWAYVMKVAEDSKSKENGSEDWDYGTMDSYKAAF